MRKEKKTVHGRLFQKTNTKSKNKPEGDREGEKERGGLTHSLYVLKPTGDGEGEGEGGEEGESRVTMSYQSKREVADDSRDSRATVDIAAEADVRVS